MKSAQPKATGSMSVQDDDLSALIEETLGGSRKASRRLFDAVSPIFLRAGRSTVGADSPDLEDFVQDAALRFFRSLHGFRGESKVRRYAYRIASNTAADWIRGKSALKRARVQPGLPEHVRAQDDPSRDVYRKNLWKVFSESLSPPQLEAFLLRTAVGCSLAEIAEITNTNEGTVRSRIRWAKNNLRQKLDRNPDLGAPWE
ncbi:MAG: RNA polymerase sigma factor [Myxococcota bacterium]